MERFRYRLRAIEVLMHDGTRKRYPIDGLTDDIERDRNTYRNLYGARKVLFTYVTIHDDG
mgnify:CR=1 FL=1